MGIIVNHIYFQPTIWESMDLLPSFFGGGEGLEGACRFGCAYSRCPPLKGDSSFVTPLIFMMPITKLHINLEINQLKDEATLV